MKHYQPHLLYLTISISLVSLVCGAPEPVPVARGLQSDKRHDELAKFADGSVRYLGVSFDANKKGEMEEDCSFYASNQHGDLLEIDYNTNEVKDHIAFIDSSMEIVFDRESGTLWSESLGDGYMWENYDLQGNLLLSSSFFFNGIIYTAFGYANGSLYGTGFHADSCEESFCPLVLFLIDPSTRATQIVGYMGGEWHITGLSYDAKNDVLYGVTDGALPAKLVIVDRETGMVAEVGGLIVGGEQLESVGSIEFDGNGHLRGCLRQTDYQPDQLLTIDPATGNAEFSGVSMGFDCTSLTLVCN